MSIEYMNFLATNYALKVILFTSMIGGKLRPLQQLDEDKHPF